MRCLACRQNGITKTAEKCPHCGAIMSFMFRDMLPPGTKLHAQRYCIDYPLGRGGFGITYRAFDSTFDTVVVIKEFFPQEQAMRKGRSGHVAIPTIQLGNYEKALSHFLEEARILRRINKENVVRVFDYFRNHNTAYIVMEMIEGRTLRELLDEQPGRRLPPEQVEKIVEQLVIALDAVHRYGIYHLDISPDNVLQAEDGKIVLIDFGAARRSLLTNETYTSRPHQFKLAYAAPEILEGRKVGPRADLFELAVMIFEFLSGTLPPSVVQRVATRDTWQPSLKDERWQKALTRALQLDPEMRPATVSEWWALYNRQGIVLGGRKQGIIIGKRPGARRPPTRTGKKR
jgi:serine/threonine protein kinase